MWGNQTYSEWFAFETERTWSLITSNFTYLCSEVPGEALFLSQGLCFFQTWRNYTFVAQSPSPGKSFECPLTPGVPHSHGVAVVLQLSGRPHSFPASPLTSVCRHQCRAAWALCSVFPSESRAQASVYSVALNDPSSRVWGIAKALLRARFSRESLSLLLLFCFCCKLSNAVVLPHLLMSQRLQFYWSVILRPGLKEMITKCFWLPNLFLIGTDLPKSSLIVVFILTLSNGNPVVAELFKIQKLTPSCHRHGSEHGAGSVSVFVDCPRQCWSRVYSLFWFGFAFLIVKGALIHCQNFRK